MKRLETALVSFVICWLLVGAIIQTRHAVAGMMGDLPKAVPAVYYADAQTFSIWSEKEKLSLFLGVKDIWFSNKNGSAVMNFTDQGAKKCLLLRPGEGIIISADEMVVPGGPKFPQAPSQPRVGPRK